MADIEKTTLHSLNLENRERLTLTGIKDVDEFNDEQVLAVSDYGELTIKGSMLHIDELNIESGLVTVTGRISEMIYSEKTSEISVLKRLFGG